MNTDTRRETVLQLLQFDAWATERTLQSVEPLSREDMGRDMKTSHSSIWGTLVHVYRGETLWLKRLQGQVDTKMADITAAEDLNSLRVDWAGVQAQFLNLAGGFGDPDWSRVIEYRLSSGATGQSPLYETILHVVNHGTYHRGQIVAMMRQFGAEPIGTDFISFVRSMVMGR